MTFVLDALRDKPQGIFQMDDASPLQDYSGYSRTGVINGTPDKYIGLVKGAAYAPILTNTITGEYSSNVFKQGSEREPFTLAAVFRVINGTGETQVLGNSGQMDGITVAGNTVNFVTKYTTAPEARCSYTLDHAQTIDVKAIHTESKNSLYVNGVLVDEVTLTEAQQADTFASTSTNLMSGSSSGTQTIAVNAVAYYAYALSGLSIARQRRSSLNIALPDTISKAFGGTTAPLTTDQIPVFLTQTWNDKEDWNFGSLSNVAVVDNLLVPQFSGDTSIPGYWYDSIALDAADSASIYGVVLDWEGYGVTIEVSLTGTSWTPATKGNKLSIIAPGYNPTDKVLLVRAFFPGGVVNDEAYLSSLRAVGMLSDTTNKVFGRTVTFSSATPNNEAQPLELREDWGARVDAGGSLTISPDATTSPLPIRTIELWVKPTITAAVTMGTTGTTNYQNGVASSTTLTENRWVVYHRVLTSDLTGSLTIDVPGQVGRVVLYPTALSAQEVADIYGAYTGTNSKRVTDSSAIGITESPEAAEIYAFDWSITGAG